MQNVLAERALLSLSLPLSIILPALQPAQRLLPRLQQILLLAEELPQTPGVVHMPGRALQTDTPSNYGHILGQPHRQQHLRSEDATVAELNHFVQHWVPAE